MSRCRKWLYCATLLALTTQLALLILYWWPRAKRLRGDEATYFRAAKDIGDGGVLVIDSMWPPAQAWLLALCNGIAATQVVQFLFYVGVVVLTGAIARTLTANARTGYLAAALLACYPAFAAYVQFLWPEMAQLFFLLLAWWVLLRIDAFSPPIDDQPRSALLLASAAGASIGMALLFKAVALPFLPVLLLGLWWFGGKRMPMTACVLLGVAVVLLPVAAYKAHHHGSWSLHTSGPFNLWVGLNDKTRQAHIRPIAGRESGKFYASGDSMAERNAVYLDKSYQMVVDQGVVGVLVEQVKKQPFRLFDYHTFFSTEGGYALRDAAWLQAFRSYSAAYYLILLVASVVGFITWPKTRAGWWVPISFTLVAISLFALLHVKARFRIAFTPCMAMFAAHVMCQLFDKGLAQWWRDLSKFQRIGLVLAVPCFLFLATAGAWLDRVSPLD